MTDQLHNHMTIELRPVDECPGCDQTWIDMLTAKSKYRSSRRRVLAEAAPSG